MHVAVMTTAVVLAASLPTYDGAAGLRRGMSPAEAVEAAESAGFALAKSWRNPLGTFLQLYEGKFAGQPTYGFEVSFIEDKLVGVLAVFQADDTRPASRRWADLIAEMSRKYGKPLRQTPYPKMKNRSFGDLDLMAARGEWEKPAAVWKFANDVEVTVGLYAAPPASDGHRDLYPFWRFEAGAEIRRRRITEQAGAGM